MNIGKRHIRHFGTPEAERLVAVPCRLTPVTVELSPNASLVDALGTACAGQGVTSAVFTLAEGSFAPMAYVMPAVSRSPDHAVYYSDRHCPDGVAHVEAGRITYGSRDGAPWLHCHARWTVAGRTGSGHVLPDEAHLAGAVRLEGWALDGAAFTVTADRESNFHLFEPRAAGVVTTPNALAVRVRPNEDLGLALERICRQNGIRDAVIRGGVGSLIGAVFTDGRRVEPEITEVFVTSGEIGTDAAGPHSRIDVAMVDYTGGIHHGELARGENPVLVTFELTLEIV